MAVMRKLTADDLLLDKGHLRKLMAEQNKAMGFVKVPGATPQSARERMRELGIRPEDNEFSQGIIQAREE